MGRSETGSGVTVAANATVLNHSIMADTIAIGSAGSFETFPRKRDFAGHYFRLGSDASRVAASPESISKSGS